MASRMPRPDAGFNPTVFYGAIALILALLGFALFNLDRAEVLYGSIQRVATINFGWLLVLTANLMLIGCLYIGLTRLGDVRLGGHAAKPEFSRPAWFAMLDSPTTKKNTRCSPAPMCFVFPPRTRTKASRFL